MRSWYYMGRWVNVWNFRKKSFLKNFNTFFCFENDLSVIFGFLTPKFMKVPVFIKVQWTKLKIWTKMHYHQFPRWAPRGRNRRIVVQIFNCNISETIWDRSLKFGTFTYLHSMYICSKLKSEKVGFRHVPLWCGISPRLGYTLIIFASL